MWFRVRHPILGTIPGGTIGNQTGMTEPPFRPSEDEPSIKPGFSISPNKIG